MIIFELFSSFFTDCFEFYGFTTPSKPSQPPLPLHRNEYNRHNNHGHPNDLNNLNHKHLPQTPLYNPPHVPSQKLPQQPPPTPQRLPTPQKPQSTTPATNHYNHHHYHHTMDAVLSGGRTGDGSDDGVACLGGVDDAVSVRVVWCRFCREGVVVEWWRGVEVVRRWWCWRFLWSWKRIYGYGERWCLEDDGGCEGRKSETLARTQQQQHHATST